MTDKKENSRSRVVNRTTNVCVLFSMLCLLFLGITLSFFRNAKQDETAYIYQTGIIADCLKNGDWIGSEAVGWHGTLFKIPAALIMLVSGPSVLAATLVTVVITVASFWLCYKVFLRIIGIGSEWWAFSGAWLVILNSQVMWGLPRFGRDIPGMFSVLILLYTIVYRCGRWAIGLAFLLCFESRECVFYACVPAFILWVPVDEWWKREECIPVSRFLSSVFVRWIAGLAPTVIWIVLMFCTNVVPLNMHAASIMGIAGKFTYQTKSFRPDMATKIKQDPNNVIYQANMANWAKEHIRQLETTGGFSNKVNLAYLTALAWLGTAFNVVLLYVGKVLYPNTFSFLGIPKLVAIPALFMFVYLFLNCWRKKNGDVLGIFMLFGCYFLIWFFRASMGRYLIPLYPIMVLCFILFLKDGVKNRRFAMITVLATVVLIGFGFYFDNKNVIVKLCMNMISVGMIVVAIVAAGRRYKYGPILGMATALLLGFFGTVAALYGSVLGNEGQVRQFVRFGYNLEYQDIAEEFEPDDVVWMNRTKSHMICRLYRHDQYETPEIKWPLHDMVPKKYMLSKHNRVTYAFYFESEENFFARIRHYGISKVGLLCSEHPGYVFCDQDELEFFKKAEWLQLERCVPYKNKKLYIFSVEVPGSAVPKGSENMEMEENEE